MREVLFSVKVSSFVRSYIFIRVKALIVAVKSSRSITVGFIEKGVGFFIAVRVPLFASAIVMPYNDISNYLQAAFVSFTDEVFEFSA